MGEGNTSRDLAIVGKVRSLVWDTEFENPFHLLKQGNICLFNHQLFHVLHDYDKGILGLCKSALVSDCSACVKQIVTVMTKFPPPLVPFQVVSGWHKICIVEMISHSLPQ